MNRGNLIKNLTLTIPVMLKHELSKLFSNLRFILNEQLLLGK